MEMSYFNIHICRGLLKAVYARLSENASGNGLILHHKKHAVITLF